MSNGLIIFIGILAFIIIIIIIGLIVGRPNPMSNPNWIRRNHISKIFNHCGNLLYTLISYGFILFVVYAIFDSVYQAPPISRTGLMMLALVLIFVVICYLLLGQIKYIIGMIGTVILAIILYPKLIFKDVKIIYEEIKNLPKHKKIVKERNQVEHKTLDKTDRGRYI